MNGVLRKEKDSMGKLIATDLDGTLLPEGTFQLNPEYYEVIRRLHDEGHVFVAASGRPEGPYENLGVFLKSGYPGYDATRLPNVVDPCTFFDKEGKLWMVYGSYSGGIYILEMNPDTGFPLEGQGYGKKLLGKNHARIEGPYILYSPDTDYYYLFLSFGGLGANDGYNIRVCRSKNPDGPYEDALGQPMIDCGGKPGTFFHDVDYEGYGVKLMGGYKFLPADTDTSRMAQAQMGVTIPTLSRTCRKPSFTCLA